MGWKIFKRRVSNNIFQNLGLLEKSYFNAKFFFLSQVAGMLNKTEEKHVIRIER